MTRAGFTYDDLYETLDLAYWYLRENKHDFEMKFAELELLTLEIELGLEKAKRQAEQLNNAVYLLM